MRRRKTWYTLFAPNGSRWAGKQLTGGALIEELPQFACWGITVRTMREVRRLIRAQFAPGQYVYVDCEQRLDRDDPVWGVVLVGSFWMGVPAERTRYLKGGRRRATHRRGAGKRGTA